MDLVKRLSSSQGDFLLFGITPPKASTGLEDLRRIAESTMGRLRSLNPDGVIVYDILDDRDRNPHARQAGRRMLLLVSQVLFDADAAKNLVSDYRDECDARGVRARPIALTLSVCGSLKTLQFLTWLGVQVPRWMQRDLQRTDDTLGASLEHSRAVGLEVLAYCHRLGVPAGFNVESVSSRRVEIDAAVQLATGLRSALTGS